MKKLLAILILLFAIISTTNAQQSFSGNWDGSINIQGNHLKIEVSIVSNNGQLSGILDIPQQGAKGLKLYSISQKADSVFFTFNAGPNEGIFKGLFETEHKISGIYSQGPASFPFSMEKSTSELPEQQKPANETDIIISHNGIDIGGTLTMPDGKPKAPLLIMSSGSGSQNRDSEIYGFKPFAIIAQHLAEHGIASFRYDDRGIGKSTGNFSNATIDSLADDIDAIVSYFQNSPDFNYQNFALLGHSQGGVIAGKVAANHSAVTQLVLMASSVVSLSDILRYQVEFAYQTSPVDKDLVQKEIDARESIMRAAVNNQNMNNAKEEYKYIYFNLLNSLPDVQKNAIPNLQAMVNKQTEQLAQIYSSPQVSSLLFYKPTQDLEQLTIPVLVLMGEKDTQVTIQQNETALRTALDSSDAQATYITFEEANHLFQKANSGLASEYPMLEPKFVDGFLDKITNWLLNN